MLKNDCDNGNDYKGPNLASHIKHKLELCGFYRHLGKPVTDRYSLRGYSF